MSTVRWLVLCIALWDNQRKRRDLRRQTEKPDARTEHEQRNLRGQVEAALREYAVVRREVQLYIEELKGPNPPEGLDAERRARTAQWLTEQLDKVEEQGDQELLPPIGFTYDADYNLQTEDGRYVIKPGGG